MEKGPKDYDAMELYQASMKGCIPTLNLLIQKDSFILNKISLTSLSETPLHISALLGHLDFTRALLALKPQLTFELDYLKRSPLHLASAEGHMEIVQALLYANKDVCMVRDQDEKISLHYGVIRGRVDVVRALINARPDSTWELLDGESVLHLCVKYNHFEALKLIIESESADDDDFLNLKDGDGENTILHLAVMLKQIETVKYLLSIPKVKARADDVNRIGFTALELLEHCPKDFKGFKIRNILMDAGVGRSKNQNNVPPLSTTAIVHHELAEPAPSSSTGIVHHESAEPAPSGWWSKIRGKWIEYLKCQGDYIIDTRGSLMVVATVIATMTFQSAVTPPGGVWQTNINDTNQGYGCNANNICEAGTSVLAYSDYGIGYKVFLACNTIAFMSSLSVLFLLISGFPLKNKVCMSLLTFAMSITLTFVALTYIYSILLVNRVFSMANKALFVWIGLVGMVVLSYAIRFLVWVSKKIRKLYLRCATVQTNSTNAIELIPI